MNLGKKFTGLLPRALLRVLPVTTVAILLIGVVTSIVVENSFYRQIQLNLEKDARFGAAVVSSKLNSVLSSIRSVAANDLVINGLVDTDAQEAYIPLYFNQLQIAGLRSGAKISFTDYRGRLIASNWPGKDYRNAKWLYRVIDNRREYIRFDTSSTVMVVPVIYQGSSEGAIVAEFGKEQLAQIVSISLGTSAVLLTCEHCELFSSSPEFSAIFQREKKTYEGWIHSTAPVSGFPGILVTVAEPASTAFASVYKIQHSLFAALALAMIALAAGIISTAYLTTSPLLKFTSELKRFGVASDLNRRFLPVGASEFHDLANSFNSMLERLQKTVVSHEQLEREVEVRNKAETALQEQNERFNVALENMSQGLCVFDSHQRIVVCNKRYATMYGLSPELIQPGTTLSEIIKMRSANGVSAGENPCKYLEEQRTEGCDAHTAEITVHEIRDGRTIRVSRKPLLSGWIVTHEDITEHTRMERLKNEFVSMVSHELRTPLTSLVGSLGIVSSGALGSMPQKAKSLLDIACRNAERLTLLVNDILDIEKISSDQMDFVFTPTDVVALAKRVVAENAAYGTEYNVRLRLEHDVGAVYANVDENRIMQVLANLLSNATKFSAPGSEVVLRVSRESGAVRFAVTDEGSGIPKDKQSQLFDRFFQVDASDSRSKRGTGLGLAIVKAIVERHGSQIQVESDVGKGSTFCFDLEEVDAPLDINSASPKIEKADVA